MKITSGSGEDRLDALSERAILTCLHPSKSDLF